MVPASRRTRTRRTWAKAWRCRHSWSRTARRSRRACIPSSPANSPPHGDRLFRQHHPRIALSIVDPANPYRYLEIRGTVVEIREDPDLDFINSMAQKYLGQEKYPWHRPGDERVVIVVQPERTTQMGA